MGCGCSTPGVAASNPLVGSGSNRVMQLGLKLNFDRSGKFEGGKSGSNNPKKAQRKGPQNALDILGKRAYTPLIEEQDCPVQRDRFSPTDLV